MANHTPDGTHRSFTNFSSVRFQVLFCLTLVVLPIGDNFNGIVTLLYFLESYNPTSLVNY